MRLAIANLCILGSLRSGMTTSSDDETNKCLALLSDVLAEVAVVNGGSVDAMVVLKLLY